MDELHLHQENTLPTQLQVTQRDTSGRPVSLLAEVPGEENSEDKCGGCMMAKN